MTHLLIGLAVITAIITVTAALGVLTRVGAGLWIAPPESGDPEGVGPDGVAQALVRGHELAAREHPLATDPIVWPDRPGVAWERRRENAVMLEHLQREAERARQGLPDVRQLPR